MNLRIDDFTLDKYGNIIDLAKQYYSFLSFEEGLVLQDASVIWRHDIDFSIPQAQKMAEIETERGVSSTFFVQLTSKFYNIFEHETRDAICKILDCGHHLGLHFDPTFYSILNTEEFEEKLSFEKQILEQVFQFEIPVFSLHMPTGVTFQPDGLKYANMLNAYASFFKKHYQYCSDSNGYWRFNRLGDVVAERPNHLHVLTHPVWWSENAMSPLDRLRFCIDERSNACEQWYFDVLRKFNRKG